MRIGIDIDGVLTDIEQWQLDYGSKYFSIYKKELINNERYEIHDIFNVNQKMDDEFWKKYLYEYAVNEPARKFASEVIRKLQENDNEIYIITARYLTDKNNEEGTRMRSIVIEWLKKQNIVYDRIIFSPGDKLDICLKNN